MDEKRGLSSFFYLFPRIIHNRMFLGSLVRVAEENPFHYRYRQGGKEFPDMSL